MDLLSLSSEDRLILHCARTRMNEVILHEVIRLLNDRIDWDYILKGTTRHGISPLMYWNLCRIDTGKKVPEDVMTELREQYYKNIARNMLIYNELSKVLKAFTDAGIDVIVLKGAFLAETVYKNIGLRAIGDVDALMLAPEDLLQHLCLHLDQHLHSGAIPLRWYCDIKELL